MPYTITQAASPQAVAECEWARGAAIRFTGFTSCVGVVAKVNGQNDVVGCHLVMVDSGDNVFAAGDAQTVVAALNAQNADLSTAVIVGQIPFWRENVGAAYTALKQALGNPREDSRGDGVYGATVDGNGGVRIS